MASSTFKSVSDTIRSKAQIFYVDTERPDTQLPAEAMQSGKHEQKLSILSSLRSRTSRNRLNENFQNSVTTTTQASDMSHEIHVEIPDSTLLETMGLSRKGTISNQAQGNMLPTTVSPLQEASSRTSTDIAASPLSLRAFIAGAITDAKQINAHRSEDDAPPMNFNQSRLEADVSDEKSCGKDLESVSDKEFPEIPLNDSPDHIATSSPATISSTRSHLGGNLFVKGNREQTRKFGIPSPYRRALQLSEEAASESSACNSDRAYNIGRKSQEDSISSRLPLKLTTSMSSGLSGLVFISSAQTQPVSTAEIEVNSSEAYDADEEYGSERSEEPSMGPKSSWEKARADRQRRYQFVRTMSAETASDHSDVPGLELRPMRDQLHAQNNDSNLKPKSASLAATHGSLRRVHFDSVFDPFNITEVSIPTSATTQRPTDTELDLTDNEQQRNMANLEILKQTSNIQGLLAVPSSCLQENHSPKLGLQIRTCSAHDDTTSSSCAVITSSQSCYRPVPDGTYHLRNHYLRRTSSIIGEIDQVRQDFERSKRDNWTPHSLQFNDESGHPGNSAAPVVVGDDTIRSPVYVERVLDSTASHSMSTILSSTKVETNREPLFNDLDKRVVLGANKSGDFVEDPSVELLPPLPESGGTPYHEPWVDNKTHHSMPGTFEPSSEKRAPKLSLRNFQDETRKDTPNLFVSMSDTRPSSVDFSMMNPEVDHYLAQAFSDVPYRVTESEYSDEENGFRTPITTPLKQDYKEKSHTKSLTDLGLPQDNSSEQSEMTCQLPNTTVDFVTARLPLFAASPAHNIDFSANDQELTSNYDEFSPDGIMLPKDVTPPALSSSMSHHRDRSWQMEDVAYGGVESTYHFGDSEHAQLQTSSLKKGVWWTRVQKMFTDSESPCAEKPNLTTLDDGLDNAEDTLRSVEDRTNESNMNIDDSKALLGVEHTQEPRNQPDSPVTEMQTDGSGDDNLAMSTKRFLTIENGIQQNRKTISDINALLATATPSVNDFISGESPDDIMKDSKKNIQWNNGHIANEYQVHAPAGSEDSLNAMTTVQDHRLRFDVEQDKDADRFASLFSHSISPFEGFQTLHQEIKTSVESLQGEEMVSSEESDIDIIGSLPHAIGHNCLRSSEESWYSFEMV
ncbi:hypothetical protein MMC15_007248 [Xylographa vitiligo]|nr:hypothetical protein [Xylographa vitiligo]